MPNHKLAFTALIVAVAVCCIPILASDYGYAVFYMRGVTVQDPHIIVVPTGYTMDLTYLPDHTDEPIGGDNITIVETLPDGVSDIINMTPGHYVAYLRQGNSDQSETREFSITAGETERVTFLGAAYASGDESCCTCHNVTVIDVPGYVIHHPEINQTILHPPGIEVVVVVDKPAWDETIEHPGTMHIVHYREVNHTEWRYVIGQYQILERKWFPHVSLLKVKCSNHAEHGNGWHVETSQCTEKIWSDWLAVKMPWGGESESKLVVDIPEHDGIEMTPGWTETVHHPAITHNEARPVGDPWYEYIVIKWAWDEQVGAVTHEERVCGQKLVCPCGCVRSK